MSTGLGRVLSDAAGHNLHRTWHSRPRDGDGRASRMRTLAQPGARGRMARTASTVGASTWPRCPARPCRAANLSDPLSSPALVAARPRSRRARPARLPATSSSSGTPRAPREGPGLAVIMVRTARRTRASRTRSRSSTHEAVVGPASSVARTRTPSRASSGWTWRQRRRSLRGEDVQAIVRFV